MTFIDKIRSNGYAILDGILDHETVQQYIDLFTDDQRGEASRGGRRNLLSTPEMRELAASHQLMELVEPVLGKGSFPVRGILFDKQDGANWKVPWHQDITIAVKQRVEVDGYAPWSIKDGVQHVQPPTGVLERMVSVRLHLDDCPASNGALRVVARTHRLGRLDQNHIADHVSPELERVCEVRKGGVLLMHPLLIHASSIAEKPRHRRVIHFDYANVPLDGSLEWFEAAAQGIGIKSAPSG